MLLLRSNQDKWDGIQRRTRFVITTAHTLPDLEWLSSGNSGANRILSKQEMSINMANCIYYTRDSIWKRNTNTVEHDRPQHDRPQHDRSQHDRPQHDRSQHDRSQHDRPQHDRSQHDRSQHDNPSDSVIAQHLQKLEACFKCYYSYFIFFNFRNSKIW
jgi:hypothetical protein